jgi:hypothetical protein
MMYLNYYVHFKVLNAKILLWLACVMFVSIMSHFITVILSGFGAHVVYISRCKVRILLVEYVLVPHSDIWFVDESSEYSVYVLWLT